MERSTRDRLLSAALQLFAEKGFAGTTTREIAERAGVNEVTLFRTFGSKGSLFKEMIANAPLKVIKRQVVIDPAMDMEEVFLLNSLMALRVLRENKPFLKVLFGDIWRFPELSEEFYERIFRDGIATISAILKVQMDKGALKELDPELAARAWIGMIQAYFITEDLLKGKTPTEERDRRMVGGFIGIYLDGIRVRE